MIGENSTRINVTISKDMAKRIDAYRKQMGLTRSAFCCYIIGQHVMSLDKAMHTFDEATKMMVDKLDEK